MLFFKRTKPLGLKNSTLHKISFGSLTCSLFAFKIKNYSDNKFCSIAEKRKRNVFFEVSDTEEL